MSALDQHQQNVANNIRKQKQRVAASELLALHDFAMKSESKQVQAFGVLILGCVADIVGGKTHAYEFSDEELHHAARIFRENIEDDDGPEEAT